MSTQHRHPHRARPLHTQTGWSITLLLLVCGASGCASAGAGSATVSDVLTREEVQASGAQNLYEAVQRLRPRWLAVRSTRSLGLENIVGVYQGQTFLGEPEVLRRFGLDAFARLRYLDAAAASASLPRAAGRHLDGAILLETR